jgi:hypothetical protein
MTLELLTISVDVIVLLILLAQGVKRVSSTARAREWTKALATVPGVSHRQIRRN